MKDDRYQVVELPGYRAIGLKWEGPYKEVGELKKVIQEMKSRVGELEEAVNSSIQLGLSYHIRSDGFRHYSVYEVTNDQTVPPGMVEVYIPKLSYVTTHHQKEEDVGQTYHDILRFIEENHYIPYREEGIEYFDELPIKHEKYPKNQDPINPEFEILVPVMKKMDHN
ncbi:Predicted transcriptional regulator YdeE, contains AraC-type DNA-binding domain [Oceanobacillus limi]|uniref:Predicted transcriptional regulator YdeE, contains AraC-type DNA-binding domain n=1 Tax=Oceanobacillus limi TaxID=930131 RepID=A0A1I0DTW1_9BACI|nr:GyrI-like domain-containing protein [Oceanobacillus limi]SET36067.1 Predicted transcriptional regulator YdeE, contains AraC-type DNA-binding domain [Oceanobacillus limi]